MKLKLKTNDEFISFVSELYIYIILGISLNALHFIFIGLSLGLLFSSSSNAIFSKLGRTTISRESIFIF
ncbi:hypothetical protein LDC_2586 [sediment metagenome]|uniref:Uncharacterized protein n=1 Tax=sediment metagenome TaxID=749907 RepID=D9PM10_9ZZZZ